MNTQDMLSKLDGIQESLKNVPGRHDQHTHNPTKGGAANSQDLKDEEELKRLQAIKYKGAMQELRIEHLKARIAADPKKWKVGMGVGWKAVRKQINRGFRIVATDPTWKTATIRQVADTGLTSSGGDYDRVHDQVVHIADLVRDRKYDAT